MIKKNNYTFLIIFLTFLLIIIVEICIVVGAFIPIYYDEIKKTYSLLDNININILNQVKDQLNLIEYNLNRNAAFFRINDIYVPLDKYKDFIQIETIPTKNIESYLWVPKVSNENLYKYEDFCKTSIIQNCTIKEFNTSSNTFIPVDNREYYWPFAYAVPSINRDQLIGFDLRSHPTTAILIDIPISNKNITATQRIGIARKIDVNPYKYGVIISKLSYISSSDENPDKIAGIAGAIINIYDIFENAILDNDISVNRKEIDLFVFDISDPNVTNKILNVSLLYKENKSEYDNIWSTDDLNYDENSFPYNLTVANRKWNVVFKYSNDYVYSIREKYSIIIISILIGSFILIDIIIGIILKLFSINKKKTTLEKEKADTANQMLAYVNHEVRNPLNVIKGLVIIVQETLMKILSKYDKDTKFFTDINRAKLQLLFDENIVKLNKSEIDNFFDNDLTLDSIIINNSLKQEEYQLIDIHNNHDTIIEIEDEVEVKDEDEDQDEDEDFKKNNVVVAKDTVKSVISDLHTVIGSCELLEHIVKDILDIRKLESGKMELDNQNINLTLFLMKLYKTIISKFEEKPNLDFNINIQKNVSLYIDPYRLLQILLNYLTNAIKFTESGTVTLNIIIDKKNIRFIIQDTGRGIDEESKTKIFKPFTQTNVKDSTRYGGIGLGLHLCKMLSTTMGGYVGFESEFNKGSSFWVEFSNDIVKTNILNNQDPLTIINFMINKR